MSTPDDRLAALLDYQRACDEVRDLMTAQRFPEARPGAERVIQLASALYGAAEPETAIGIRNLAIICEWLGDPGAGDLYDRAAAICDAKLGPDHERSARYRKDAEDYAATGRQARTAPAAAAPPAPADPASGPPPDRAERLAEAQRWLTKFAGREIHTESYGLMGQLAYFVERTSHEVYAVMVSGDHRDARLYERTGENIGVTADITWVLDGPVRVQWTTEPDPSCEPTLSMCHTVLGPRLVRKMRFSHMALEFKAGIVRKTFTDDRYTLVVHTRPAPGGLELALQPQFNRCRLFFQDAESGELSLTGSSEEPPF